MKEIHRETVRELSCKFDEAVETGGKLLPKSADDCSSLHSEESNSLNAAASSAGKMEIMMHISNECRTVTEAVNSTVQQLGGSLGAQLSNQQQQTAKIRCTSDPRVLSMMQEMQSLEKQLLQIVRDQQQQSQAKPEQQQQQQVLLRKIGEKFKLSQEKMEGFMDKRLKTHINSISSSRRAQTQALEKQLKGVEEKMQLSYDSCSTALDSLREVVEVTGVARSASVDPDETLVQNHPSTVDSILDLVVNLKRVQAAQSDILRQGDKTMGFQAEANAIFGQLVPTLEVIHAAFQGPSLKTDNKKVAKHIVLLPKLCNELRSKIQSLSDLETRLMSVPKSQACDDVRLLVGVCGTILERLLNGGNTQPSHPTEMTPIETQPEDVKVEVTATAEKADKLEINPPPPPLKELNNEELSAGSSNNRMDADSDVPSDVSCQLLLKTPVDEPVESHKEVSDQDTEDESLSRLRKKSGGEPLNSNRVEPLVVSRPDGKLVIRPKVLKQLQKSPEVAAAADGKEEKKKFGPKRFRQDYSSGGEESSAGSGAGDSSFTEDDAKRPEFQPHVLVSDALQSAKK